MTNSNPSGSQSRPDQSVHSESINQACVDFEEWCRQEDSTDLERFIQQQKVPPEIAAPLREIVSMEQLLFLENSSAAEEALAAEFDLTGTEIGDFRLLQPLGQGGMGTVWLAQQQRHIERQVAIKLIRPGFDSEEFIRRFSLERQALAVMSHPNIARILDAGLTPQNRPYFVMEYLPGVSIIDYCEQHPLPVTKRLELFLQLSSAIQHAHQKGVIHRDIKPSNVLIVDIDGKPTVKVIDFGLAKACESNREAAFQVNTTQRTMIGSPLWMSPEQVDGLIGSHPRTADTRSDVYSLGAVLYQLISGTTPIRHETYLSLSYGELLKKIKEEVPPPPSVRLQQNTTPADNRQRGRWHFLNSYFRDSPQSDLDWIVMKAIEKDPDRRYEGVDSLVKDIQRFLDHEPVLARRPSKAYQLKKFLFKHRLATSFAIVTAILLVIGTVVSTALAFWALNERDVALKSQQQAEIEIKDRERVVRLIEASIWIPDYAKFNSFSSISFYDVILRMVERIDSNSFVDNPRTEALLRKSVGQLLLRMRDFPNAKKQLEVAYEHLHQIHGKEHELTTEVMFSLANISRKQQDYSRAIALYQEVIELRTELFGPYAEQTLFPSIPLAAIYREQGETEKALKILEETNRLFEEHHGMTQKNAIAHLVALGAIYREMGDKAKALGIAERIRSYLETNRHGQRKREVLTACNFLMKTYSKYDRVDEAIQFGQQALKLSEKNLSRVHTLQINIIYALAELALKKGDDTYATELLQRLVNDTYLLLGEDHPTTIQAKTKLAEVLAEHATAPPPADPLTPQHDAGSQAVEHRQAVRDYEIDDAIDALEQCLAEGQVQLGTLYNRAQRPDAAIEVFQLTLDYFQRKHGDSSPETLPVMRDLVVSYRLMKSYQAAVELGERVLSLQDRLCDPQSEAVIDFFKEISECYFHQGEHTQAIHMATERLKRTKAKYGADDNRTRNAFVDLRAIYLRCHQRQDAISFHQTYLDEIVSEYGEADPISIFERKNFAIALQLNGEIDEATKHHEQVVELCQQQFGPLDYYTLVYQGYLQNHLLQNANHEAALPVIENWVQSHEKYAGIQDKHLQNWATISLAECQAYRGDFAEAKATILEVWSFDAFFESNNFRNYSREFFRARSILGWCLAQEGNFSQAESLAIAAFHELSVKNTTHSPYHRWYVIRAIERIIEIYQLAEQPEKVTQWKNQLAMTREQQEKDLPEIAIK